MVDIHSHILPGLDDGAATVYDTLDMADLAYRSGTEQIVATPHCNIPGIYKNYYNEAYEKAFIKAKEAIESEGIPVELMPGMEVFATDDLPQLIAEKKLIGLNNTKNLLIEFDFGEDPEFADTILNEVQSCGMTPVIAHAERYMFVQNNPETVLNWHRKGYFVQVNKGSFWGRFGRSAERTAFLLLNHNLITAIASDSHSPVRRTPSMSEVYEYLAREYPEDYLKDLFATNPGRLCRGEAPIQFQKIPFDEEVL